ncbi:hypothetical protein [Natrinema longum]|uniref:hypothetical protein n=1 Tax=Natrinema longum TaxID=370324 RepID=UPI001CCE06BB|nr:hypothetical protein [Natrinema longum]MBZ6496879.1 hypothetical protein [Natrinema longum]
MLSGRLLTPFRREFVVAAVAILLLLTPVWVSVVNLGEATYTYERAEVVVDEEDGITYAGDPQLDETPISTEIGCSVPEDTRTCAFERSLLSNATIPTDVYTNNPAAPFDVGINRYQYVAINGSVYDASYIGNQSVQRDDGLYRIDLALEPTTATDALRRVSVNVSTGSGDVHPVVVDAARQGTATADRAVEVPQTPLRLADGTYYRVFLAGQNEPTSLESLLGLGLSALGPIAGLYLCYRISRRVEIRYVGNHE